jgi:hypothetical protein
MSFDRLYHDDPVEDQKSRASGKISGLLALVLTIFGAGFYLQSTLAANVSLNSGGAIEFGQGSARTVACSEGQSLIITPLSSFTNSAGAGSHKFSSIKVTNIPTACQGQDFTFSAYNNVANSAAQAIFNTSSTRAVVHMTEGDTFEKGIGGTGLSVTTNSASSFTVTFTAPVVASSSVFNLTVESVAHTAITYNVGDTGPGNGIIYYVNNDGFSCGATYITTGSPTGGLCNYLEVAPSGWNTGDDPLAKWASSVYQATDLSGIPNESSANNSISGVGLGYKNSLAIVAQGNDATTAAGAARAYTGGSKSDWYLPTIAELNLLCQWGRNVTQNVSTRCNSGNLNTGTGAAGGFVAGYYWSSSEKVAASAWRQNFASGVQDDATKGTTRLVRPVRAF